MSKLEQDKQRQVLTGAGREGRGGDVQTGAGQTETGADGGLAERAEVEMSKLEQDKQRQVLTGGWPRGQRWRCPNWSRTNRDRYRRGTKKHTETEIGTETIL